MDDREDEYDREIGPIFQALHAKCKELGFPMFATVCYERSGDGQGGSWASYAFSGYPDGDHEEEITNFVRYMYRNDPDALRKLVDAGADVEPEVPQVGSVVGDA